MSQHQHPHESAASCHCVACKPLERPCGCASCEALGKKPPTQVAGVEGIAPKPIELTPERPRIDWPHLIGLPPFQMFAIERAGKSPSDFEAWMPEFLRGAEQNIGAQGLYDEYCQWHAAKGYWPNEDPMGRLVQ